MTHPSTARRHATLAACALLLAGCASVAPDSGFGQLAQLSQQRTGKQAKLIRNDDDARALDATLTALLRQALSADNAVEVALLNNRGLQASYWSLGIAQADLAQAGRLHNPTLGFKRTHAGADIVIERTLTMNLVDLLTKPLSQRIEARRFEQTRLLLADAMVRHAADTRRAYYEAVAAQQGVAYAQQVRASAEAGAELAGRMAQAGNFSQLDLAREQAYDAEASAAVGRARIAASAAREKVTRLMGLWGAQAGYALPRMKDGVKEFHLVAEPVLREIAPGMKAKLWGYNGQSPGPTIEVVEGDRVRIFVTNKLPEHTSIHWHGQLLPNGMDGVTGLTQPGIEPGKTFMYEFVARHAGTFMYHPHADEMAQMAMGMMGFWVTHPKEPAQHAVDRDFVFLLNAALGALAGSDDRHRGRPDARH